MKKALLLLSAMTWSIISIAQEGLQVGLIGGPQSTWLVNHNDSDDGSKRYTNEWRGFVGATVDYNFSPTAGVGIELLYSWQGQAYTVGPGPSSTDITPYSKSANYFKIPVLLNFSSSPENVVMFVGKFGPVFGFNTADKVHNPNEDVNFAAPGGPWNLPDGLDISSQFQSVTVGAVLGLGMAVNIKKMVLITAGIRLDGTLTNPLIGTPDPNVFSYYDGSTKSYDTVRGRTWEMAGGIEIGVRYVIPVGKHHGHRR